MKKLLKLSLILTIVLAFFLSFSVYAVPTNHDNETDNSATANTATSEDTNVTTSPTNSSTKSSSTQVTTVSQDDKKELETSDILNILLIATGVVIILLAIAIFIKIK